MRYTLGDFETPRCFHESGLTLAVSGHPVVRGHPMCSCRLCPNSHGFTVVSLICPDIVKIVHNASWGAYESRYAPYAPRDYADLAAIQALCGDHSDRDALAQ